MPNSPRLIRTFRSIIRAAAVTLAAFEKAYRESLGENRRPKAKPRWAVQVRRALAAQAHAPVPAESYQDAAEGVRRLGGQLLPFEAARGEDDPSQTQGKADWDHTVEEGLRKTYRQGHALLRQVEATPESPDEQWHKLRKRAKDLGYQLGLLKKVKGVKPLLAKLDEAGGALGDARDLSLLGNYLDKVRDKRELSPQEQQSYRRFLRHVEHQRELLHRQGLQAVQGVYRSGAKKFTARLAKRWRRWHVGY